MKLPTKTMISDKIIYLEFPDQISLGTSLVRIQEYYESPKFKGQIFTLGAFREWYSAEKGSWSFYTDWAGYNVPSAAFKPFQAGLFDPLCPEEQQVLALVQGHEDFYLIATYVGSDPYIYPHEVAHAMYATNPAYRHEMDMAMLGVWDLSDLTDHFHDLGYHPSVWIDECHAYLATSTGYLNSVQVPYPKELADTIQKIFESYLPEKGD